mmetsp:Transcript_47162/g.102658  ORF Transcript_47162/g.102658 Transcript_47162/m.102658 type:complete len:213 (+) Transcript_47162:1919-2557(+)
MCFWKCTQSSPPHKTERLTPDNGSRSLLCTHSGFAHQGQRALRLCASTGFDRLSDQPSLQRRLPASAGAVCRELWDALKPGHGKQPTPSHKPALSCTGAQSCDPCTSRCHGSSPLWFCAHPTAASELPASGRRRSRCRQQPQSSGDRRQLAVHQCTAAPLSCAEPGCTRCGKVPQTKDWRPDYCESCVWLLANFPTSDSLLARPWAPPGGIG